MSTAHSTAAYALAAAFDSGNEELIVEELRKVRSQRSRREARIALVTRILEQTGSPRVRNAAALALADLRAHNAKNRLIELLKRPDTKGRRGTILYALEQLNATVPISLLIDLILEDSYEAREEALNFIRKGKFDWDKDQNRLRRKLAAAVIAADDERSYAINTALERLMGDSPGTELHEVK